jgi:chromatin segregation and condensation protein Rec8/ScpA/Scc1 (kleisin family)
MRYWVKLAFFSTISFPPDRTSHTEQVTGFLALLELLRLGRIRARQDQPFAAIEISDRPEIIEPPDGVEPPGREEQDGT